MSGIIQSLIGSLKAGFSYYFATYANSTLFGNTFGTNRDQVLIDSTGNIYIGGNSVSGTNYSMAVAKINSTGSTVTWGRKIGTAQVNICCNGYYTFEGGICVDSSGNVYMVGGTNDTIGGWFGYIVKYNSSGTLQFQNTISQTSDGNYTFLAVGCVYDSVNDCIYVVSNSRQGYPSFLTKYDTAGSVVWAVTTNYIFSCVTTDSSGNVYVGGTNGASPYAGIGLYKFNSSGTLQFQFATGIYGSSQYSYGIAVDSSGNIYVTGDGGYTSSAGVSAFLIKYNSSGTVQWSRGLVGAGFGRSVQIGDDGFIYMAYATGWVKYNSSGTLQLQREILTTNGFYSIVFGANLNIYLCGYVAQSPTSWILTNVPKDGSKTSPSITVSSFTFSYVASSYTEQDAGLTAISTTATVSSITPVAASASGTSASITITPTVTTI